MQFNENKSNSQNKSNIDVRAFMIEHYTPYEGDASFLTPPTERTLALWDKVSTLLEKEQRSGGRFRHRHQ